MAARMRRGQLDGVASGVSKSFRTEFLDAARSARLKLGSSLTTQRLLDDINGWLADYRSDHQ
jgi:hypothetical protein